ncbi:MAG: hypothetical protein HOV83_17680 [Catenulispora sp.]|nr:hypothetical protein [Catenulispora sp.]
MRHKRHLAAAAAAGLLAPLVLALPASASTDTAPVSTRHGHGLPIIGDLLGGSDYGSVDHNRGNYDRHRAREYGYGSGSVTVYASGANRNGNVSIIVEGSDLPPLMNLRLSSAGLDAACVGGNSLDGATVQADLSGDFNVVATGTTCIDGTYRVDVSEQSTPYQTFSADVTIES